MRHPQGDGFLNWLHVIFLGPQTGGKLDSEWGEHVLENLADPDLLSLPHSAAFAPSAPVSLSKGPKVPNQYFIFLVLYPARSHAYMVRPMCNTGRKNHLKCKEKTA